MSAGTHTLSVPPRMGHATCAPARELSGAARAVIRVAGFAALGLYGIERWSRLIAAPATGRLLGLLVLAVAVAGAIPVLRRLLGGPPATVAAFALCLLALPIAGLPWQDFVHLRLALGTRHVGAGLAGLPAAILPYAGSGRWVATVITLGAAVLLLDAAIVLAFTPAALGDLRRASAALPLIALAVVPSTLVRPQLPYLQGVVLFALLATFLWGERLRRQTVSAALILAAVAAVGGGLLAPRLDSHHAWVDYRAWAGGLPHARVDAFAWNQTYGPLHWPRKGHVVMTVAARSGDYWKAENLDVFNGRAWVAGTVNPGRLPAPSPAALGAWSQVIKVRIGAMRTADVIASGFSSTPVGVPGGDMPGASDGTWTALRPLGSGATYVITTYAPHPGPAQLSRAGRDYPGPALDPFRSIALALPGVSSTVEPQLVFPGFYGRRRAPIRVEGGSGEVSPAAALARSPYGPVYALAQRLAASARTPYAFAVRIKRYLAKHAAYNENPPVRAAPLAAFLLHDHIGYCQQFSGAMALLLRMGGVPARVATGFTPGVRPGGSGPFTVTDVDAHAWVEAWFPGYGWVRFDPTPAIAPALGGHIDLPVPKSLPGARLGGPGTHGLASQPLAGSARPRPRGGGGGLSAGLLAALIFGLGLVAAVGLGLRRAATTGTGAEGRLRELERALARTGRPLDAAITLAELEHRFRGSPGASGYVRALRLERYRPGGGEPPAGGRRALRAELAAGLGLRGRIRALWALPPHPRER